MDVSLIAMQPPGLLSPCVSVIMPVFNEAPSVEQVVRKVLAQPCVAQLVVVDDASTDGSKQILERLATEFPHLRLVRQAMNAGKGAAVRKAFTETNQDILLIQDADLEYAPEEYSRILQPILANHADAVFGSRFLGSEAHRVLYYWHSVANRILTLATNMVTNLNLTDMECCFKAFRRTVIDRVELVEDRFGIEPELTIKIARLKVRVYEVSVSYCGRTYAEGKKIGWKDGVRALYAIAKYGLFKA